MPNDSFMFHQPPRIEQNHYLINGKLENWSGPVQTVTTPINQKNEQEPETHLGHYPLLTSDVAMEVLTSAKSAYREGQGKWPSLHPLERVSAVRQFVSLMKEKRIPVARTLIWEVGKTLSDALNEFDRTVEYIEHTVDFYEAKVKRLTHFQTFDDVMAQIQFSPRGICLCMGPYNYPLNETYSIIIPALLTGNIVIFKPPRLGVLLHQPLLEPLANSFPPGVVNTVYGEGEKVISPLMSSGQIDVLAFIGSSKVADVIKKQHPLPHRLHTILGLEAKNPAIVYQDCDLDNTIAECCSGALSFNGQRCTALKIIFVERAFADKFVSCLAQAVDRMPFGYPWEAEVKLTPLPERKKIEYLEALIDDAVEKGAVTVNALGGHRGNSCFFPAVLYPVSHTMRIAHEEQFGPIIPVVPFDNLKEVEEYIVASPYGQQLSVFTSNETKVTEVMRTLAQQVSRININSQCQRGPDSLPFTGRKDSAQGVLSIREAIRAFTLPLVVAGKSTSSNNALFRKTFDQEKRWLDQVWRKIGYSHSIVAGGLVVMS
jgi:glyceraldehyde-3-phosphate dehydrogenase (NADP+)